jgi:hypothetical protein
MTAFEPGVVVHADPGEQGDLFPSQARDASPVTEAGQPSLVRRQPGSTTGQELLNVPAAIHVLDATTRTPGEPGPVSTRITTSSPGQVLAAQGYLGGLLHEDERLPEWTSLTSAVPAFESPDFVSAQ